jgi:predicted enzyme related to lactoylglutathione lyase
MATTSAHEPGTPAWLDLMTPDLEAAQKFYGGLFGWTFTVGPPETLYYTMCKLNGKNVAGMGKQPEGPPVPTVWNLYFLSKDIEETTRQIIEKGGKIVVKPHDVMDEGRMAVCADPTGAVFGLWEGKAHQGAAVIDEPGAMTWHEVNTRRGETARDFYAKVMNLEPRKMQGVDIQYWSLHRGEKAEVGVLQMDDKWPEGVPAHWMNYFAVADTDGAIKKVSALGGVVKVPPFDTPYGRIAVVSDPMGATFSLVKPTAA